MEAPTTRLAPSPTGALHLGNARTFLINWALARQNGWRVLLRIEDLDSPRVKTGADQQAINDLGWLGLDWDGPVHYQRHDLTAYERSLNELRKSRLIYPCTCSRLDIRQAMSAPNDGDHELRYTGRCRSEGHDNADFEGISTVTIESEDSNGIAWRLIVPDEAVEFEDQFHGLQSINVQRQVGDFVVATKERLPAYQLAVVVDDAQQRVTDVVRGDDLLGSTARQLWIYRYLGLTPIPRYTHLPLVVGTDGRRLAKRHGDSRLSWYRQQGVPVERVIGLIAWWCRLTDKRQPMKTTNFVDLFSFDRLPCQHVTFTLEDQRWLMG